MKITVGQEYEVIADHTHHLFGIGSVIRVIEIPEREDGRFRAVGWVPTFTGEMDRWVIARDVRELVTEEEVEKAIASIKNAIR